MSNDVRVTNWPTSGGREQAAVEVWKALRFKYAPASVDEELDLLFRCWRAAGGSPHKMAT